jgi:hypothetical protein
MSIHIRTDGARWTPDVRSYTIKRTLGSDQSCNIKLIDRDGIAIANGDCTIAAGAAEVTVWSLVAAALGVNTPSPAMVADIWINNASIGGVLVGVNGDPDTGLPRTGTTAGQTLTQSTNTYKAFARLYELASSW